MQNFKSASRRDKLQCLRDNRSGNVIVLAAAMLVVLFAMVAFAVDIGYIVHVDTELQRTADACALSAVQMLPDKAQATAVAQAVATENYGTAGPDLEVSDIEFGDWDRETATFTPMKTNPNGVRITVRRTTARGNPVQLFIAPVLGYSQADVTATAIAMYDNNLCGPLIGIEWISVPGGPTTDSYLSSLGNYDFQSPRDNGSLCSDGPIGLEGNPVVNGDANPGRNHKTTLEGGAVVTGNTSPRLRPLNLPYVDATEVAAINDNGDLPLIQKGNDLISPVDGGRNFLLDAGKTYTMPQGEYYLNDFTLTGNSTLNFEGPTTIYLTGTLDTAGGYLFNHTAVPNNVRIFMTGSTARLTSKVDFYGVVFAPNTAVTLDGSADWYGSVVGRTLTATGSGDVHYDEDLDVSDKVNLPKRVSLVQ